MWRMCTHIPSPSALKNPFQDEWPLDNPTLRNFIARVNDARHRLPNPAAVIAAVRPYFETLLADKAWLPELFQEPAQGVSGMGKGIGMWLLHRSGDGGLAFSALVLPKGASTPVHDHLAWGIVGLYRGLQDETVFARGDDGTQDGVARLAPAHRNMLKPGDFYELLPENDIHQVTTVSEETSVSLHLLGNDNGCIWRHRFTPTESKVEPFKSGWLNVACRDYA